MTLKYYLSNFYWGLILFGIIAFILRDEPHTATLKMLLALSLCSGLIFPFAKKAIERIALKYTTYESWTTGYYKETPMKNGYYAMFFMVIFAVAIPVGTVYLIFLAVSKKAT